MQGVRPLTLAGTNNIVHLERPGDTDVLDVTGAEPWNAEHLATTLLAAGNHQRPETGTTIGLDLTTQKAHWIDRRTIAWPTEIPDRTTYALVTAAAGGVTLVDGELAGTYRTIPLQVRRHGLTAEQRERFPHLGAYQALTVNRKHLVDVPAALRGHAWCPSGTPRAS